MRQIGKKTLVWDVTSLDGALVLGQVRWFSLWRKYALTAITPGAVFDEACLREIADFVEERTRAHKALV
jgi:hypothetical protein